VADAALPPVRDPDRRAFDEKIRVVQIVMDEGVGQSRGSFEPVGDAQRSFDQVRRQHGVPNAVEGSGIRGDEGTQGARNRGGPSVGHLESVPLVRRIDQCALLPGMDREAFRPKGFRLGKSFPEGKPDIAQQYPPSYGVVGKAGCAGSGESSGEERAERGLVPGDGKHLFEPAGSVVGFAPKDHGPGLDPMRHRCLDQGFPAFGESGFDPSDVGGVHRSSRLCRVVGDSSKRKGPANRSSRAPRVRAGCRQAVAAFVAGGAAAAFAFFWSTISTMFDEGPMSVSA